MCSISSFLWKALDKAKATVTEAAIEREVLITARPADAPSRSAALNEGQKQNRKRVPIMAKVPLCRDVPRASSPFPILCAGLDALSPRIMAKARPNDAPNVWITMEPPIANVQVKT